MKIVMPFRSLGGSALPLPTDPQREPHVAALFDEYCRAVVRRTHRFFTWLLSLQWAFALVLGTVWSPRTWSGPVSSIHPHLIEAVLLGGLLTLPPIWLMVNRPYQLLTRHAVAVAQMGFSALLIDLTGGRIETHFHVFGSLAFLALYRDWRVMPTATLVVAMDHVLRGIWFPESVYGVAAVTVWRTGEHVGWVLFEDVVLVWACFASRSEMWEICLRHDQNSCLLGEMEERVRDRTRALEAEAGERAKLHRQLIEASRLAGRADVATGVLHNVGNVLTSVNLTVHDVQDRLHNSRLSHLHRLVETVERERPRLAEYLTEDPVGRGCRNSSRSSTATSPRRTRGCGATSSRWSAISGTSARSSWPSRARRSSSG